MRTVSITAEFFSMKNVISRNTDAVKDHIELQAAQKAGGCAVLLAVFGYYRYRTVNRATDAGLYR